MHVSSWIMRHFTQILYQNDHQSKIYTNIIMNGRIDEIENQPLEEKHLWITLSKACNGLKLLYDTCGDDWWKKWSSNARESSRFCKLHWTFKLRVWSKLARFDPSPRSICLKTLPDHESININGFCVKNLEIFLREKFGWFWDLDLKTMVHAKCSCD